MIAMSVLLAAATPTASPGIVSVGNASCADLKPENMQRIADYVTGFWSGMNVAGNTPAVGHSTDERGIVKEIIEACLATPNLSLGLATLAVHMKMEREKR